MKKVSVIFALCMFCITCVYGQLKVNKSLYKDYVPSSKYEIVPGYIPSKAAKSKGLLGAGTRPSYVYNNKTKYFPPIFNQAGGSCGSASAVSYVFTYEMAAYRDLDASLSKNQYPSHFTWLLTNQNSDKDAMMAAIGVPNVDTYGGRTYSSTFGEQDCDDDYCGWMQGYDKWYSAMFNKITKFANFSHTLNTEVGREELKQWLWNHSGDTSFKSGGVATIGVAVTDCSVKKTPSTSANNVNGLSNKCYVSSWGPNFDHGVSIVGYDDRIEIDFDGNGSISDDERGAWIIANSWGNSWADGGFVYLPYKLGYSIGRDQEPMTAGRFFIRKVYTPQRVLKIKMEYDHRSELLLMAGVSNDVNATKPDYTIEFEHFRYAGNPKNVSPAPAVPMLGKWKSTMNYAPMEFGYDLTDLTAKVDAGKPVKYFFMVKTKDGAIGNGKIYNCSLMNYENNASGEENAFSAINKTIANNGATTTITMVMDGTGYTAPSNLTLTNGTLSWSKPTDTSFSPSKYIIYNNSEVYAEVGGATTSYKLDTNQGYYTIKAVYTKDSKEIISSESNAVSPAVNASSTSAVIKGDVNSSYIGYLRDLVLNHSLTSIDMSEANIVEGGNPYLDNYTTTTNIFPQYAFAYCPKLKSFILPESIESIGSCAFTGAGGTGNGLTKVVIPDNVVSIGNDAFSYNGNIKTVVIGSGVRSLSQGVWYSCGGITDVYVYAPEPPLLGAYMFGKPTIHVLSTSLDAYKATSWGSEYGELKGDLDDNFDVVIGGLRYNLSEGKATVLAPEGATNTYTGEIVIPEKVSYNNRLYFVTKISGNAFSKSSITSLTIPNTVVTIDGDACAYTGTLTKVNIGSGVTFFGQGVFYSCDNLKKVYVNGKTPAGASINAYFFSSNPDIFVDAEYYNDYSTSKWADYGTIKINAAKFTIEGITYSILGPNSVAVTYQEEEMPTAAEKNSYTGDIVIPSKIIYNQREYTVTKLGEGAFKYAKITSLKLPETIERIDGHNFNGVTLLKELKIPNGVTYISGDGDNGSGAKIPVVIIGNGIQNIDGSFLYNADVKDVYIYAQNPPSTGVYSFSTNPNIHVFSSAVNAYKAKDGWTKVWGKDRNILGDLVATSLNKDENGKVSITGVIDNEMNVALHNMKGTSYDLTGALITVNSSIDDLLFGDNVLTTVSPASGINGKNIINNGVCEELVLTDNKDFAPGVEFVATSVTMEKPAEDDGWYTMYLPYAFTPGDDVSVYTFKEAQGNSLVFEKVTGEVPATTPLLCKRGEGATVMSFGAENVAITTKSLYGASFNGTFVEIPAGEATGNYILNATGTAFGKATAEAYVPAFHCYYFVDNSSSVDIKDQPTDDDARSKVLDIVIVDPTGVKTTLKGAEAAKVFGVLGVAGENNGVNIKEGKKYMK